MTRFQDRVAIVTGAGAPDGIGAAVARALVEEGARVVLGAMSERVHQRAAELGPAAVGVVADLTVDGAANALVQAAPRTRSRISLTSSRAAATPAPPFLTAKANSSACQWTTRSHGRIMTGGRYSPCAKTP